MGSKQPTVPPTPEELAAMGGKPKPSPPPPPPKYDRHGQPMRLPPFPPPPLGKTIWLAVQVFSEDDESRQWSMEIVGAFETESEAVKACKAENYCIGPLKLGAISPAETTEWAGAYYPLAQMAGK